MTRELQSLYGVRPLEDSGQTPCVRVLVAEAEGSAPREAGAAMRVWAGGFDGTIGGGTLEHQAIAHASALCAQTGLSVWHRELRTYPLGPALGQCCGGMVRLLFEVLPGLQLPSQGQAAGAAGTSVSGGLIVRPLTSGTPPVIAHDRTFTADWPLPVLHAVRQMLAGNRLRTTLLVAGRRGEPAWLIEPEARAPHTLFLYGAGHVGRAVVRALQDLPFAITWIDTAADRFPAAMPQNATPVIEPNPARLAAVAPAGALHLVMTFSHALDLAIIGAVLAGDFAWAGLIGSATKRARFEKRLRQSGVREWPIGRLQCPIGIGGITGKEPAMIAISVAAQLATWASSDETGRRTADAATEGGS